MSTQTFTRQTHNTSFVAYATRPSKKPQSLMVNGQAVQAKVFPDVFINEYTSVKIKEVNDAGDTANVKVDATSVQTTSGKTMKYDFGANVQVGSPVHALATEAANTGRPVYLSIETRRRYKSRGGDVIPYTVPIDVLRGCTNGPQSPGNSNATGDHCSKVIAAMGWADEPHATLVSDEATSDPFSWPEVRDNQDGDLAPAGFVIPTTADGERVGGIIEAPASATAADGDLVRHVEELKKMVAHLQRSGGNGSGAGVKPWNERQEDGSVNPASYAVTQARHTRATATRVVADAAVGTDVPAEVLRERESALTRVLLWIADGVQYAVTGGNDRMAKSFSEAGAWVAHVITVEDPYTASMLGDDDHAKRASTDWAKRVRSAAAERYREAVVLTAENLGATVGFATPDAPAQDRQEQPVEAVHSPASDEGGQEASFADDQGARQLWDQLIHTIGMVSHIDQLNPALTARFGTHLSAEIPARAMREALAEWTADPQRFLQWAEAEYRATAQGNAA